MLTGGTAFMREDWRDERQRLIDEEFETTGDLRDRQTLLIAVVACDHRRLTTLLNTINAVHRRVSTPHG